MPISLEELWAANIKVSDEVIRVQKRLSARIEELEDKEGMILMIELVELTTKFFLSNAEFLGALTGTNEGEYIA